jgi:hypothetical protein
MVRRAGGDGAFCVAVEPPDEPLTEADVRYNSALAFLHAALAQDAAFQGLGVEVSEGQRPRFHVVTEPGRALSAETFTVMDEVADAITVDVAVGPAARADLEDARQAVETAAVQVIRAQNEMPRQADDKTTPGGHMPQGRLSITTDWVRGAVVLQGDTELGERIAEASRVRRGLVVVESRDGPTRLTVS